MTTQASGFDVSVRAYGSRCLHIVAGNAPSIGALSVMRGAITRGDTIIKVVDRETDEVIRQIPSEEVVRLRQRLEEVAGVLFDGSA